MVCGGPPVCTAPRAETEALPDEEKRRGHGPSPLGKPRGHLSFAPAAIVSGNIRAEWGGVGWGENPRLSLSSFGGADACKVRPMAARRCAFNKGRTRVKSNGWHVTTTPAPPRASRPSLSIPSARSTESRSQNDPRRDASNGVNGTERVRAIDNAAGVCAVVLLQTRKANPPRFYTDINECYTGLLETVD
ncbi:hypothetical protein P4O66_014093 [Electrophorus voltai]|uniref:Uncharacterized protein n=1 Tax=Electrophorus voltai TaxID=2609070 RepID=A0AAD9DQC2_9TELE|nr:hypothetical protein P4O66_014093 [Electrophorus voltai]